MTMNKILTDYKYGFKI